MYESITRINSHGDAVTIDFHRTGEKLGVLKCRRPNDRPCGPGIKYRRQRLGRAQAPTNFHRPVERLDDLRDDRRMSRRTGECTIEIDYMQLFTALTLPVRRLGSRIVAINRHVIFAPLAEAHTFAALEIDCRKNCHVC